MSNKFALASTCLSDNWELIHRVQLDNGKTVESNYAHCMGIYMSILDSLGYVRLHYRPKWGFKAPFVGLVNI